MAKHKNEVVSGGELIRLIEQDGGWWSEVLRDEAFTPAELAELARLNALDAVVYMSPEADAQVDAINELHIAAEDRVRAAWWVVMWPEHVNSRKYDGDAAYHCCATEAAARLHRPNV